MSNEEHGAEMPSRVVRHRLADRAYHWLMAASMLTLLFTSFLPILGLQFPWVDAHWVAGVILIVLVLFHIVRALFVLRLADMWVGPAEFLRSVVATLREMAGGPRVGRRVGKYSVGQKMFHHVVAVVVITASVTGVIMMVGVDSPFWERNPLFISEKTRGVVFLLHGLAGLMSVTMVTVHIYFAIRPEKRYMTRSMLRGWISRDEYEAKHDPALWPEERQG
jgi:cytochrome b subunit of formate dehydrogenase